MRPRFHLRLLPLVLAMAACAKSVPPPVAVPAGTTVTIAPVEPGLPTDWKSLMLPADVAHIDALDGAWVDGLAQAKARRFEKAIIAEGPLLDPAAALPRAAPPPGRYRCRTFKLGLSQSGRGAGFARFKPFYCFIATEGALLTFTKATGTQRPGGRFWDDGEKRMIFLGGVSAGRGAPPAYGADARQNRVGVVERIGDFRWRLVTPGQSSDARIEVIELVPDTPPPTEAAQ